MRIARLLAFLFLISAATPVAAEDYAPGTVGHLIEDCKKSLNAATPQDFFSSWCNRFLFGYQSGWMGAAFRRHHDKGGPKYHEKCTEMYHKNAESPSSWFCPALWELGKDPMNAHPFTAVNTIVEWGRWLNIHHPADLKESIIDKAITGTRRGAFCDHLTQIQWQKNIFIFPWPKEAVAESDLFGKEFDSEQSMRDCMTEDKYLSLDPASFMKTGCGAISAGMLAGIKALEQKVPKKIPNAECTDYFIKRTEYNDPVKSMCIPESIKPDEVLHTWGVVMACKKP